MSDDPDTPRLLTVRALAERHDWLTIGSLRRALLHADRNGLDAAIVRFGARILVDEAKFIAWLRSGAARRLAPIPAPKGRRTRRTAAA